MRRSSRASKRRAETGRGNGDAARGRGGGASARHGARRARQDRPDSVSAARCSPGRSLPRQLFVDDRLERLERLRADQRAAVDVDRRRRVHAHLLALRRCRRDRRRRACRNRGTDRTSRRRGRARGPSASAPAPRSARWLANIASCISQYLPCSPAQCAASAAFGACGMVRQRKVLEDDPDLVAVGLRTLVESRIDSRAERSLIVGELDERHRRVAARVSDRSWTSARCSAAGRAAP